MPYRAGEDRAKRIARLREERGRLEPTLTTTYRELLAEEPHFVELTEALGRAESSGEPERIDQALTAYVERLRAAIADAPRVRAQLLELPDHLPADALTPPWREGDSVTVTASDYAILPPSSRSTLLHDVASYLGTIDPQSTLEHRAPAIRALPVVVAGVPMGLEVTPVALTSDVDLTLVTPVRRALAPVRLERFTWLHTVTTAVQLQSDTRVGDDEFDDHFLVEASKPAARRLLDAELRNELLGLSQFATPRLVLGRGLATLRFRYAFSPTLVERACRILALVRSRKVDVTLLR